MGIEQTAKRKPCCQVEQNLSVSRAVEGHKDVHVQQCIVCGCRHFELMADPLTMRVVGTTA